MWVWSFSAITLLSLWVASSTLNLHSFSLTATEYYSKQINSTVQDPPQRVGVKCCAKRHFSGCKTQSRLLPSFWWRRLWKNKSGESQILNSICENSWSRVAACAGTFVAPSWPTYFDVWVCVCVCVCVCVRARVLTWKTDSSVFLTLTDCTSLTSQLGNNVWNEGCVCVCYCVPVRVSLFSCLLCLLLCGRMFGTKGKHVCLCVRDVSSYGKRSFWWARPCVWVFVCFRCISKSTFLFSCSCCKSVNISAFTLVLFLCLCVHCNTSASPTQTVVMLSGVAW